jgi:hypothetical protein
MGYGQDGQGDGFWFLTGAKDFSDLHSIQTGSGAHPASYPVGTRGLIPQGVEQMECEPDHSPPSSTKVRNWWSYTFTPPYIFLVWCLIKPKNNLTFTFEVKLYKI